MEQPSLFDPAGAAQARADGIDAADTNADRRWKAAATDAVRWCATHHTDFTSDEVLARLANVGAPTTHELSALGPVFLRLAKAREIVKTGELRPSKLRRRHRDLVVWAAATDQVVLLRKLHDRWLAEGHDVEWIDDDGEPFVRINDVEVPAHVVPGHQPGA